MLGMPRLEIMRRFTGGRVYFALTGDNGVPNLFGGALARWLTSRRQLDCSTVAADPASHSAGGGVDPRIGLSGRPQ